MTITAVVQARLGSKRLPMKALLSLNGRPMLDQVFKQLRGSHLIQKLLLSTSDEKIDELLAQHCENQQVAATTGPVNDIVGRLHQALQYSNSDIFVRVWGDCPFVCPDVIDSMLNVFMKKKLAFMANSEPEKRSFPLGLDIEIYSAALLKQMQKEITDKKLREFPAIYVRDHLPSEKVMIFQNPKPLGRNVTLTVDYPEDLAMAAQIYAKICPANEVFGYEQLSALLEHSPELFEVKPQERNIEFRLFLASQKMQKTEVFLEGPNITLKSLTENDLLKIIPEWINDQEVTQYLARGSVPSDPAQLLKDHLKLQTDSPDLELGIYDKKTDSIIGVTGIHSINQQSRHGEFRILIGEKQHWGRGLGTETCRLLATYCFEKLNFNKVWLGVNSENQSAYRSYVKSGFSVEGLLRQELFRNGRYFDITRMSLLKSEYTKLKSEWSTLEWVK